MFIGVDKMRKALHIKHFSYFSNKSIYTAANNIFGFLYAAANSITQACMSFTSQNYGAGKWKRMDKVLRNCICLLYTSRGNRRRNIIFLFL